MHVKRLEIKNFVGLRELNLHPGKINVISGHKGCGKTSLIEAMEKGFTNKNRRTEVIHHGENEATIFIQTDTNLEIERKIRTDKADYLKIKQPGKSVPNTEKFLRKLINGEIFRPLEFVKKSPDEQAKIILNMLEIPWSMDDISQWFSEIPDVNYEAHILMVLKQIEDRYYKQREAINREIKVLEAQVEGIKNELPQNYNGDFWRDQKVQDYYNAVAEAEETNKKIAAAQNLIEGLESRVTAIKAGAEVEKQTKKNTYDRQRSEGKEFIQFLRQKIDKAEEVINGANDRIKTAVNSAEISAKGEISEAELDYQKQLEALKAAHEKRLRDINETLNNLRQQIKDHIQSEVSISKDEISKVNNSITAKEQEILNVDALEEQSLVAIDEKVAQQIETENAKAGNAKEIIESTKPADVEPLRRNANEVADMQSYLREYDRMGDIIRVKLAPRQEQSQTLTARIEKARELPMELLKIAAVPIPGIAVDDKGCIRVNGTLIDGLSEGEQLELAFGMAKAQAGDLKVICLDGINKINESDRQWIEEQMKTDDHQYFILSTCNGELNVEIKEGI